MLGKAGIPAGGGGGGGGGGFCCQLTITNWGDYVTYRWRWWAIILQTRRTGFDTIWKLRNSMRIPIMFRRFARWTRFGTCLLYSRRHVFDEDNIITFHIVVLQGSEE
jgi:hypothetical protein